MSLSVEAVSIPLQTDSDGVVRIGQTRVTLDTVIAAFEEGATPEEIVFQYPALRLGEVYSVVGYYLQHQKAVRAYLKERARQANRIRKSNEARYPPQGIRSRLLGRRR
jgi:uncharacterized protein (DUF433 family)